jgi:serine/threonine protein kinase
VFTNLLNIVCITKLLTQGGGGFAFVAKDAEVDEEVVLKLIQLGPKGNESRKTFQKELEREMKIGLIIASQCKFLISYSEIFEYGDYFCIRMEYCVLGDLKHQLDSGKVFAEEVLRTDLYFFFYFSLFFFFVGKFRK